MVTPPFDPDDDFPFDGPPEAERRAGPGPDRPDSTRRSAVIYTASLQRPTILATLRSAIRPRNPTMYTAIRLTLMIVTAIVAVVAFAAWLVWQLALLIALAIRWLWEQFREEET